MSILSPGLQARPFSIRLRRFLQKYFIAYLFIAAPVIGITVFMLGPMIVSFSWSFTDYNGLQAAHFIGLKNYIDLFKDSIFLHALSNTAVFVLLGMSIGPTLGLLSAVLLNQSRHMQAFFRTAFFMPVMTSLVVVSTIWITLYNRSGIFNSMLQALGLQTVNWLSDPHWALFSIVIASVWQGFGFETVVFLAALQGIPRELYEAALIDGAGPLASLWFITLPSLRPVILFIYIYGIIGSWQLYDQVYVMTQGGPVYSTTSIVYYLLGKFQNLQLGYASSVAYILFIILVIFSFLQYRFFSERG
jgi:ABC-type sugar transport system permease subunit